MSIQSHKSQRRYACLAVLGLFTSAGCGEDRPIAAASLRAYRPPATVTPMSEATPAPVAAADPLTPPDPMAVTAGDGASAETSAPEAKDETPDPMADAGTGLGAISEPKMPTQHSHWLNLAQFGERVTVRLNGVWYGEFCGPALRDITMRLQPGVNTLMVTSAPQSDGAWLAVHVTEGEHTPPAPDLVTYRIAPVQNSGERRTAARSAPTTRTFRFTAQ